jgi:hypothetical protein
MPSTETIQPLPATTPHGLVLPFYLYASVAFVAGSLLLLLSATDITGHYFHPHSLAMVHIMALGWGTMIILGSGHQLVPVLIEGKLYSGFLARLCFLLAAIGIPLLAFGFLVFDMGWPAKWGGRLIILAILAYLINLGMSMQRSKRENIHALFVFTSVIWLLATCVVGLILVYNFTTPILPAGSLDYLPMHAHMGIAGWFLLLIIGVASRLFPLFMLSKYEDKKGLWWIYGLINSGLLLFIFLFLTTTNRNWLLAPLTLIVMALILFIHYCLCCYRERIRRRTDGPMRISLLSLPLLMGPAALALALVLAAIQSTGENIRLIIVYGFVIFFGWITALILGMTFKTLPFIIWNKVYHSLVGKTSTPNPNELYHARVFRWMTICYLLGFPLFLLGIICQQPNLLHAGAFLLVCTSVLYILNVLKMMAHKAVAHG